MRLSRQTLLNLKDEAKQTGENRYRGADEVQLLYIKVFSITDLVISPMYDTVNFRLSAENAGGIDFLQETPRYLDFLAYHDFSGKTIYTGSLWGLKSLCELKVTITSDIVKVGKGSLCKWHLGDNCKTMRRRDTQEAIEALSDILHLPMAKADVTRMDVAQNFIVKYPPAVYFNHLGGLKYAERLPMDNGLYYKRPNQVVCIYDKNKERGSRGESVPDLFIGRNVLRYEQRYTQRLGSQFRVEAVKAAMLYDEKFYIDVIDRWHNTYKNIEKINDISLNFGMMRNKRQLNTMGILALVERVGGEEKILEQIEEAKKRGELTSKQAFDLRQAIKEACKMGDGMTVANNAIAELDKEIKEAVRYYR